MRGGPRGSPGWGPCPCGRLVAQLGSILTTPPGAAGEGDAALAPAGLPGKGRQGGQAGLLLLQRPSSTGGPPGRMGAAVLPRRDALGASPSWPGAPVSMATGTGGGKRKAFRGRFQGDRASSPRRQGDRAERAGGEGRKRKGQRRRSCWGGGSRRSPPSRVTPLPQPGGAFARVCDAHRAPPPENRRSPPPVLTVRVPPDGLRLLLRLLRRHLRAGNPAGRRRFRVGGGRPGSA